MDVRNADEVQRSEETCAHLFQWVSRQGLRRNAPVRSGMTPDEEPMRVDLGLA